MFKRILIANRGEIALRTIRACKKLGIETVAIYSEADHEAPHRSEATVAVCVGGPKSADSYLNMEAILQAAEQTEANAIHPGYGFLAENALFAELCNQLKFTFIGPSPQVIRLMGDKATARRTMKQAGLRVIPGSEEVVANPAEALDLAHEIGFPVLLKATAGGGGKGMRICRDETTFSGNYAEAVMEAEKAFGNPGLYLEQYVEFGRHIEFQFLADSFGNAVHLGERECSVQRSHQKLVEESPSPIVDPHLREEMGERVRHAVAAIGYVGAGTMEFLRAPNGDLYFMEVNTRLQVEHPVTEMVTGFDLVEEQIRVAANHELSMRQADVHIKGHAIECRVNAEDPLDGFKPCPGLVERFEPPEEATGVRVRVDTYVSSGTRIPVFYDSLVCKLIVAGEDRDTTRRGMIEALKRFRVEGIKTTIPLHIKIMENAVFASGNYNTSLLSQILD